MQPLGFIVRELTEGRAKVHVLLSAKDSPHTYTPLPRDIRVSEESRCLFFTDAALDGWASQLPSATRVEVYALTPKELRLSFDDALAAHEDHDHDHSHAGDDPHFWMDPVMVKATLPALVKALADTDPEGEAVYRSNAIAFAQELDALHGELEVVLAPVRGAGVVLMHPSMGYLLHRYGLTVTGVIEPSPGKEPSARDLKNLIDQAQAAHTRVLFTEPQLPRRNAEVLAESLDVPLYELDPNGGIEGRNTYSDLIRYNAKVLAEALS
ncbi:MAG: zinc ABC transporter substrate-binding protein [Candidatus Hydrogenedentota bacterium]